MTLNNFQLIGQSIENFYSLFLPGPEEESSDVEFAAQNVTYGYRYVTVAIPALQSGSLRHTGKLLKRELLGIVFASNGLFFWTYKFRSIRPF